MAGYLQQHEQYIGSAATNNNAGTSATTPASSRLANSHGGGDLDMANDPPGHMQAFNALHARRSNAIRCASCGVEYDNNHQLVQHGSIAGHQPYACTCGSCFGRGDVLQRHVNSFNSTLAYECNYCSRHDGKDAFTRWDHLKQHLKGYHRFEDKFLNTLRQRRARQISVRAETPSQIPATWPMAFPNLPVLFGEFPFRDGFQCGPPPVVSGQNFSPGVYLNVGGDVTYGAGLGQDFSPVQGVGPLQESGNVQVGGGVPAGLDPQLASSTRYTFDLLNFNDQL